jgi:hypothetical protein
VQRVVFSGSSADSTLWLVAGAAVFGLIVVG